MSESYSKMSVREKIRSSIDSMTEPPVRCPHCDFALNPVNLLSHVRERCPGTVVPHRLSKWISVQQAASHGISRSWLRKLSKSGRIRTRTVPRGRGRPRRYYLERDVVLEVARRLVPAGCNFDTKK